MAEMFQSRDTAYRAPFGAVCAGTAVHLRLRVPRELGCRAALLRVERQASLPQTFGMFWAGMAGDTEEWWECHYTPESPDLYWYDFILETDNGRKSLCRKENGAARLAEEWERAPWQLTCYAPAFRTPDWLKGGLIYQIFPDRFARSDAPKEGVPADRVMHAAWGEPPVWQPNAQGEVENNDYFGGDLRGIIEKLEYLQSLGVTCLYLNPVFEAHSNHRYNTADYLKIDPLLGTEDDLRALCAAAKQYGMRVLLDGVFSHTGSDSRYFNKNGRYETLGAYQSPASPYYRWYTFRSFPNDYAGWWGFPTLPEVNECDTAFSAFITGEDGVVPYWLKAGASGWRLDVADELPDAFLDALRRAVKAQDSEALVLGEVWEDASNKHSYGHLRRYLLGDQLDSVMNYPFREAVLGFVCGGDATEFCNRVWQVVENYPAPVLHIIMNLIGTHDTERALTVLGGIPSGGRGRAWQAEQRLTAEERTRGVARLKLASLLQYCLPGVPSLYYGDEAGMEGYRDPFNRGCYPWGAEDEELLAWYRALGKMRAAMPALRDGTFEPLWQEGAVVAFVRRSGDEALLCAVNRGDTAVELPLPAKWQGSYSVLQQKTVKNTLVLSPCFGTVLQQKTP